MKQNNLPHGTLPVRIATPILNAVRMKSLLHPSEERESQQLEQIKEDYLQGPSPATTSTMNSRRCPGNNVMSLLNGSSPIRITVSPIKMTK